jgi:hypothetical protein
MTKGKVVQRTRSVRISEEAWGSFWQLVGYRQARHHDRVAFIDTVDAVAKLAIRYRDLLD